MQLPFDGELVAAKNKRFPETIVFVHHFGGSKKLMFRHARLVNELGYDAIVFNLAHHDARFGPFTSLKDLIPITGDLRFGLRHIWTGQIEAIFNSVAGDKILFSLSMPTTSTVEAIANRGARDVRAMICDGGPFLRIFECVSKLFEHNYQIQNRLACKALAAASLALYNVPSAEDIRATFEKIPKRFPVLSLRGRHDPLVSIEAIGDFFACAEGYVALETVILEKTGHLDGLKLETEIYRESVRKFLAR